MKVDSLLTRAARVLHDEGHDRWTRGELVGWLNDGLRATVSLAPEANTDLKVHDLAAGTVQSAPAGALRLVDFLRNVAADGTTAGRAVRTIDRAALDLEDPDWHTATAAAVVKAVMFDQEDPKRFYVTPPNDGTGKLAIVVSEPPAEVTAADTFPFDDAYAGPVLDYMLYRALSKDAAGTGPDTQRALLHLRAFATVLTGKESADTAVESS